jgi:hypothetical protein
MVSRFEGYYDCVHLLSSGRERRFSCDIGISLFYGDIYYAKSPALKRLLGYLVRVSLQAQEPLSSV